MKHPLAFYIYDYNANQTWLKRKMYNIWFGLRRFLPYYA